MLLEHAPVLTFGSTRLSFSQISVSPHPPPSGRQRPFLWLAPLARFSALSAAVYWASLSSHIKHELFVTSFGGGFLGLLLYPSPLTAHQIHYSHLSIRTALNNHFYAISDKHILDFHTSLLKEAPSNSLMLLQVFPSKTSYLYHYKTYSWYSSTIILLLFHCNILFPLR